MTETTLMALLLAGSLLAPAPASTGNTAPPPALAVTSPTHLVSVPGSPVLYGANAGYNLFAYGGRYFSFYRGAWFFATSPGAAWSAIATSRVPKPVLAVPLAHHKN